MKKEAQAYYFGNSMKGVFRSGDALELAECAWDDLQIGDIVAVQTPELLYVHRVIRKENGKIITQGDHNPAPDRHCLTAEDVFQKVTGRRDRAGKRFPVSSGCGGMAEFQRHQRYLCRVPWRRRIGAICFWRRTLLPEMLGDDVWEWCWKGTVIARRSRKIPPHYCRSWYRLFFRLAPVKKETCPEGQV